MQTLILGAGATGGYFGARLLEAGADVTFLVRPKKAEQLRETGLIVKSATGDITRPDVKLIEKVQEPFELIILSCKAFDLPSAIAAIKPGVGSNTTIFPLLNGLRHIDELQKSFGKERVIGGMCIISATVDERGRIVHLNDAHTLKFGELNGDMSPRIKAIKEMTAEAKNKSIASTNIQKDMWEKWVMLATLAGLNCLMRANIGEIARSPGGKEIAEQMLNECLAVMKAHGHEPGEQFVRDTLARSIDEKSTLAASMLRDLEKGNNVEGDQILGDLIARAEKKDVEVPALRMAYCNVKAYEQRRHRI
ncbi:MAG: 2-dehydropantoate 2-reductase [Candidatus Melainabacteria bacterium]|nr:MAG: 2-dehydropantoate 2-reductase [Candidatus Melainabacteria bacterium]